MIDCAFQNQLDAYFDDELAADARVAFAVHLSGCRQCSQRLADLQAVSELFASVSRPGLSQIAMRRLHHRLEALTDRGLIRLGWSLSAIAASLLLVGSVWLTQMQSTPQTAPPWVGVSVAMDTETGSGDASSITPAAQWYLADASTRVDDTP